MIGGHMISLLNLAAQSPFHFDFAPAGSALAGNYNSNVMHIDNSNYVPGQNIVMPDVN